MILLFHARNGTFIGFLSALHNIVRMNNIVDAQMEVNQLETGEGMVLGINEFGVVSSGMVGKICEGGKWTPSHEGILFKFFQLLNKF